MVCFKVPGDAESAQHVGRPAGDGRQAAGGAAQVPADEQRDGVRHQGGPRAALHPSARQLLQGAFYYCFCYCIVLFITSKLTQPRGSFYI